MTIANKAPNKKFIKRRMKRPIGYPKRPLSAYNLFFRHERKMMLIKDLKTKPMSPKELKRALSTRRERQNCHRKVHGRFGFKTLTATIAARWNELSKEDRTPYHEQAKIEKKHFALSLKEWNGNHHDQQRTKGCSLVTRNIIQTQIDSNILKPDNSVISSCPTTVSETLSADDKLCKSIESKTTKGIESLRSQLDSECLEFLISTFTSLQG